jgi:hypothetical protein
VSWEHFLGTGRKRHALRCASLEDARAWVAENLPPMRGKEDWEMVIKGRKLPREISRAPDQIYRKRKEWKGWSHFLSFEQASKKAALRAKRVLTVYGTLGDSSVRLFYCGNFGERNEREQWRIGATRVVE